MIEKNNNVGRRGQIKGGFLIAEGPSVPFVFLFSLCGLLSLHQVLLSDLLYSILTSSFIFSFPFLYNFPLSLLASI